MVPHPKTKTTFDARARDDEAAERYSNPSVNISVVEGETFAADFQEPGLGNFQPG
jgi:hypothetical protein